MRAQRGAALLLAMVVLTLVATLAAGMVWQQTRAVQLEAAARQGAQAEGVLDGAFAFGRLILRDDARSGKNVDDLTEQWALPLAETRLSSFLAADRDNNADADIDVFLAGQIVDAEARYNLRNLIDGDKVAPLELRGLERLCDAVGVPAGTASLIATGLRAAWSGSADAPDGVPLPPTRIAQLVWLGLDAATVARLEPYLLLLPGKSTVNANTAPAEVLLTAVDGLDMGGAQRIVQARNGKPFQSVQQLQDQIGAASKVDPQRVALASKHFYIYARLRSGERVVVERVLVERRGVDRGTEVVTLLREPGLAAPQRQ